MASETVQNERVDEVTQDKRAETALTSHFDSGSISPGFSSPTGLVEVGDWAWACGSGVGMDMGMGRGIGWVCAPGWLSGPSEPGVDAG